MTRLLGAILAGGRSRRFGSDKALAQHDGRTLLDWSIAGVRPYVEQVVVCGRGDGLADRPPGGLGPLAGLNAALHAGRSRGFDAVLTVPCDVPRLPPGLLDRLIAAGPPASILELPVIGLWHCDLADALDEHLRAADRSVRGWARACGVAAVPAGGPIVNVNRPEDLNGLEQA